MSKTELPDDQQPDGELDGTEMVAYDRAQELSQQFDEIQTATIGDGLIQGAVEAIEASPNNGSISIEVDVPAETEPVEFFLEKPKSWNREYDFVRWVEDHGYDAGDFEQMIQKRVRVQVRRDDDEYELVIPERVRDHSRKLKPAFKSYLGDVRKSVINHDFAVICTFALVSIFMANYGVASLLLDGNTLVFAGIATIITAIVGTIGAFLGVLFVE